MHRVKRASQWMRAPVVDHAETCRAELAKVEGRFRQLSAKYDIWRSPNFPSCRVWWPFRCQCMCLALTVVFQMFTDVVIR